MNRKDFVMPTEAAAVGSTSLRVQISMRYAFMKLITWIWTIYFNAWKGAMLLKCSLARYHRTAMHMAQRKTAHVMINDSIGEKIFYDKMKNIVSIIVYRLFCWHEATQNSNILHNPIWTEFGLSRILMYSTHWYLIIFPFFTFTVFPWNVFFRTVFLNVLHKSRNVSNIILFCELWYFQRKWKI